MPAIDSRILLPLRLKHQARGVRGLIPSWTYSSKNSYGRVHLGGRPLVGGHTGPPLQEKIIKYLYECNLVSGGEDEALED
jgi:hypothetical protein